MALTAASPPGGPDAVRRAAHDILSRPEFQTAPESPVTRVRRWIGQQINHALNAVLSGSRLGIVGIIIAVAVVAALVVLIVLSVRGTTPNPVLTGHRIGGRRRSASDWLADASDAEARGDWRGALRCRYRALVADLAARGVVEEIAGRTTGEYRQAVGAAVPSVQGDFSSATEMFERAWYGDEAAGAEETARFRDVADRVMAGAR
jgi:hypothetical protein